MFDKIFLINLKNREDRLYFSKKRLSFLKLNDYVVIEGVKKSSILDQEYLKANGKVFNGMVLSKGLYCCGLSHLKILDYIEKNYDLNGDKIFLILEDDFMPLTSEQEFRKYIEVSYNSLPDYWKILLIGTSRFIDSYDKIRYNEYISIAKKVFHTHCFLLKNDKKIFNRIYKYFKMGYWADENFVIQQQAYNDIFVCNRSIVDSDPCLDSDILID